MIYRWLWLLMMIFSAIRSYAAVQMHLEPAIIHPGQTLQLTITVDDPHNQGMPDLAGLRKNFAVIGTQRTVNYSVVNGQAHSLNQWIILLEPQKTGKITIPPIQIGAEKTPKAVVTVDAERMASDASSPEEGSNVALSKAPIQLNTHLSTSNPYVNQQVIYKVSLMNSRRLLDAEYTPPQVKDALMVTLGDPVRHQAIRDGVPYVVESLTYAIYPQKSGTLKITPPRFSALLFDTVPGKVQVQGKPAKLEVKSIPSTVRAKVRDWLPAEYVTLSEQYDHENTDIEQGAMLVRNVTLEVHGLPAQMLPHLSFGVQQHKPFSVYSERPQEETQIKKGQLVSVVRFKVSYLFNQIGAVTIPALRLGWFNVNTGKIEYAELPQHSVTVHPGAQRVSQSPVLHGLKTSVMDSSKQSKPILAQKQAVRSSMKYYVHGGWVFAGIFAILWIITCFVWWHSGRRVRSGLSYRQIYQKMKQACYENNPRAVKDNLLLWAPLVWPDISLLSLSDLEKQIPDGDLKHAVQQLIEHLYKNETKIWQGHLFWQVWAAFFKAGKQRRGKPLFAATVTALPPLNPPK